MMKLPRIFKSIKMWVWIIAIFLALYHVSKLFAIFAPPLLIGSISSGDAFPLSGFITSMDIYFQEASKNLNIEKSTIMAMAIYSGSIAIAFLTTLPFLLRGSNIARQFILVLIGIELMVKVILGIYYSTLPDITDFLAYVAIFIFLSRKAVSTNISHNIGLQATRFPRA